MRKMSEKHAGNVCDFVTYLLRDHIYCQQTLLVTSFINDYGMINNLEEYTINEVEHYYENKFENVKEWRLITPQLSKLLNKHNEIVITLEDCNWWGRLSSDDLHDEEVFREIYQSGHSRLYK